MNTRKVDKTKKLMNGTNTNNWMDKAYCCGCLQKHILLKIIMCAKGGYKK